MYHRWLDSLYLYVGSSAVSLWWCEIWPALCWKPQQPKEDLRPMGSRALRGQSVTIQILILNSITLNSINMTQLCFTKKPKWIRCYVCTFQGKPNSQRSGYRVQRWLCRVRSIWRNAQWPRYRLHWPCEEGHQRRHQPERRKSVHKFKLIAVVSPCQYDNT